MNALSVRRLTMQFGGLLAVSELELEIPEGAVFGLIGPNGAGKTTVFNLLTGVYRPTEGTVSVFGRNVTGLKPSQITSQGIARTFQNIRLFKNLSVLDNLRVALDSDPVYPQMGILPSLFRARKAMEQDARQQVRGRELLALLGLAGRADWRAMDLPYGDQRRLEIARAMATGARLLLLDEPAAGLNPRETSELIQTLNLLRNRHGMTILLIEHDMRLVMGVCERIAVMEHGIKIAEGSPAQIRSDLRVIEAYLGKAGASHAPQ